MISLHNLRLCQVPAHTNKQNSTFFFCCREHIVISWRLRHVAVRTQQLQNMSTSLTHRNNINQPFIGFPSNFPTNLAHGQLYTALSRIRQRDDSRILLPEDETNVNSKTSNFVYKENC
ncbi:hypothetical protein P692DRAFT_201190070 [Suillus brevipes Sb2]|nr:hypothetical protein P692DRAFT_201190070 [Suillus brevipes Sb2]